MGADVTPKYFSATDRYFYRWFNNYEEWLAFWEELRQNLFKEYVIVWMVYGNSRYIPYSG